MTARHGGGPSRGLPLIFLGPSLSQAEARCLCQAEYRGPIRRGDLASSAGSVPRIIGIVDGAFHHSLTVSPREVQEAIARGHRVYGAASIGALRSVELDFAAMIGVGRIYEAFASGA
ncbi:MAG: TfuA-like protein, partial [Dehalococcoidia bacterium]